MEKILDELEKEMREEAEEQGIDIEEDLDNVHFENVVFYYGVIRGIEMIRSKLK